MNVEIAKREVVVSATFRFDVENQPAAGLVVDQLKASDITTSVELSKRPWEKLLYTAQLTVPGEQAGDVDYAIKFGMQRLYDALEEIALINITVIQVYARLVEYPKAPDSSPEAQHG